MMQKPRTGYGRSRVTPRASRRPGASNESITGQLAAARRVAVNFVAARWPELSAVRPAVTTEHPAALDEDLLARLGLGEVRSVYGAVRYTFTFCGERATADGRAAPLIAVVTVDEAHRIIKTSVSR